MAGQGLGGVCPRPSRCPSHVPEVAGACAKGGAAPPTLPLRGGGGPSYGGLLGIGVRQRLALLQLAPQFVGELGQGVPQPAAVLPPQL